VLDRFDFLLRVRLRGAAAGVGIALMAALAVSLLGFFLLGNARVPRILYFPGMSGTRTVAELRFVTRRSTLAANVRETVESVLLGPSRANAERLFPRGATVLAVMVSGRTLYLDLAPQVLAKDPEAPLGTPKALGILTRSLHLNFPRFSKIVYLIDGQVPTFPGEKKI
jgi:hypothetical protein